MAQASTAAREPSMEEILASIRRIIEDSDAGRKHPALDGSDGFGLDDDFRAEFQAANSDRSGNEAETGFGRDVDSDDETLIADQVQPPVETFDAEQGDDAAVIEAFDDPIDSLQLPDDFAAEITDVAAADEAGPDRNADVFSAPLRDAQAVSPRLDPILSERTGRQVAAAFEELSDAFAASRRRSFDEMAEEMLRPMLQDWLDDNLPTLVERLVREEIERVARGGSR